MLNSVQHLKNPLVLTCFTVQIFHTLKQVQGDIWIQVQGDSKYRNKESRKAGIFLKFGTEGSHLYCHAELGSASEKSFSTIIFYSTVLSYPETSSG